MKRNKNSGMMLNFRHNEKNDINFSESIGTNMEEYSSENVRTKKKKNYKVQNDFNILEIIITQFFKCCMCTDMKLKNDANEKAYEYLYKKLDVSNFVRNTIVFDIMNRTMINSTQKSIINFLSRPVISINKKNKENFEELYKNYREKDFNKFCDNVYEIVEKSKKEKRGDKLITFVNEQLGSLAY